MKTLLLKFYGLLHMCIGLGIGLLLGFILLYLQFSIPTLLSKFYQSGIYLTSSNVPIAMLIMASSAILFFITYAHIVERRVKLPLLGAFNVAIIPALIFGAALAFGRSEFFAQISSIFFLVCFFTSLISVLVLLKPSKQSNNISKIMAKLIALLSFLIIAYLYLMPIFNSLTTSMSFPVNSSYEARLKWTNEFMLRHKKIQNNLKLWNPLLDEGNFAFVDNRIHTIVDDWMDGLRYSASFELSDGRIEEFCRGESRECFLATGKSSL